MNPNTRRIVPTLLGVVAVVILVTVLGNVAKANRSCETFQLFCAQLRQGNWEAARQMVASSPASLRVEKGAVYYWDADITTNLLGMQPLVQETFTHYFTHSGYREAVFFGVNGRECGYAQMQEGKLAYVKLY